MNNRTKSDLIRIIYENNGTMSGGSDKLFVILQCIGCGEWNFVNETRETAIEYLRNFSKVFLKNNNLAEKVFEKAYFINQSILMELKADSFEIIQTLPPFNEFGKQNLIQMFSASIAGGQVGLDETFENIFSEGWEERQPKAEIISILQGNGESMDTAVKFSTADVKKRTRAEYWFIVYNFGKENTDWERGIHSTVFHPKNYKMISRWNITLSDRTSKSIYFDTNTDD